MTNKVTEAFNNFQSKATRPTPAHEPSRAAAAGINPPPLNEKQLSGIAVEATLAGNKAAAQLAGHEKYHEERRKWEAERDELIWQKIQARRVAV